MFDRIVSIDWAGAGTETEGVDLRIVMYDGGTNRSEIISRTVNNRTVKSWSRAACRTWLHERLAERAPTLVAMDFGFGLPWGSDCAVYGVKGWHNMIREVAHRYNKQRTARATAEAINAMPEMAGNGPYRFDADRSNFRFYLDNGVPYFRLTEVLIPQAISQWYLGSGGTVGFHTITGLTAIADLIKCRERGEVDFEVWPHETLAPDGTKHVLVESYPAICPAPASYGRCDDDHQKDAWKVLQYLLGRRSNGSLPSLFEIPEQSVGRIDRVRFEEQIQFEGFIVGLK